MAHIPPKRGGVDRDGEESPIIIEGKEPITIEGKSDTIRLNVPLFYAVDTFMSIKLSNEGGVAKVRSIATEAAHEDDHDHDHDPEAGVPLKKRFRSKITRIELEGVVHQGTSGLVFKPDADGKCMVKIFFAHADEP